LFKNEINTALLSCHKVVLFFKLPRLYKMKERIANHDLDNALIWLHESN
jgi:hypothetical protein